MAELILPNSENTASFLSRIGFEIPRESIMEVFPGYFPDRRVLRVRNDGAESSRVLKVRPDNDQARAEAIKLISLLAEYRFCGAHFQSLKVDALPQSKYLIMNMPYLGIDITKLGQEMDLVQLGYKEPEDSAFTGFTESEIKTLIKKLKGGHTSFTNHYQLVHGDLFPQTSPNNIVYNLETNKLFFVDAEALTQATPEAIDRFNENMDKVEEWMFASLYKNGK